MNGAAQTVITLTRGASQWLATWAGPEAEHVEELFGTATIPTPFSASMAPDRLLASIRALNPECIVRIGGGA